MKIVVSKKRTLLLKNEIKKMKIFRWDSLWVYHPRIIKKKNKYYLYYTGRGIKKGIGHMIGLAVGTSLKKFKKLQFPILNVGKENTWDDDCAAHPFIFKDKDKYLMLYDGSSKKKWHESIGLARSLDLLQWNKDIKPIFKTSNQTWESKHVSRASVFKKNDMYYLFYTGHDGKNERIGLATGNSLNNLKRFKDNPVVDLGEERQWDNYNVADPLVIKYKKKYLMFYSGIDEAYQEYIGIATSSNLYNWKKYKGNPILSPEKGSWDQKASTRFDLFKKDSNRYYLFYSGKKSRFWNIGYVEVSIYD